MNAKEIIEILKSKANAKNVEGMARFGINKNGTLGVAIPDLRKLAKNIGKDHKLAGKLWRSKIHEAKILASYIEIPELVTEGQFEKWVKDFDSWDVCDQVCSSVLDKTKFAYKKIFELSKREKEFVKRTAFTLMACSAVHDKHAKDSMFVKFFPIIKREASDERNYVKKAVNWALRQIGKRNYVLNGKAIKAAKEIRKINSKSARWIASNALTELKSEAVQKKVKI